MSIKLLIGLFVVVGGISQAVQRSEDSSDFVEVNSPFVSSKISAQCDQMLESNVGKKESACDDYISLNLVTQTRLLITGHQ